MIAFRYILFFLFFGLCTLTFSKEIVVDNEFTSKEIYNVLTRPTSAKIDTQFVIEIINKQSQDQQLYLSIINPTLDKIIIKDKGKETILGDLIRYTKREFKHINHVYPILLKANEHRKIQINIPYKLKGANFRIDLSGENSFIKTTNHDYFLIGIFYGIIFMYLLLLIRF